MENTWPKLDYTSWSDTLDTLHQWLQIVGKIRLRCMPWHNAYRVYDSGNAL